MNYEEAIEILIEHRQNAKGELAAALKLAIAALDELDDRREAEVEEAVENVGILLGGSEGKEQLLTWQNMRRLLNIPDDILDEVERRLELAAVGEGDK